MAHVCLLPGAASLLRAHGRSGDPRSLGKALHELYAGAGREMAQHRQHRGNVVDLRQNRQCEVAGYLRESLQWRKIRGPDARSRGRRRTVRHAWRHLHGRTETPDAALCLYGQTILPGPCTQRRTQAHPRPHAPRRRSGQCGSARRKRERHQQSRNLRHFRLHLDAGAISPDHGRSPVG